MIPFTAEMYASLLVSSTFNHSFVITYAITKDEFTKEQL